MTQRTLAAAVLAALLCNAAYAISNDEVSAGLQFNFSNPGARSLGMGGAFTGLADDATAAFANPAGLTILAQPEMAAEYRYFSYDTRFVNSGTIDIDLPINGGPGRITRNSPNFGNDSSNASALSYFSYVLPRETFNMAFFYATIADFNTGYATQGSTLNASLVGGQPFTASLTILPVTTSLDLKMDTFGVAFGFQLSDTVSVGFSLQNQRLNFDSLTGRQGTTFASAQAQQIDDAYFTGTLGVLWRSESGRWSSGLAYRHGAEFKGNAASADSRAGAPVVFPLKLDTPKSVSWGIAFRPIDSLTLSADINHVIYSSLSDNIIDITDASAAFVVPRVSDGTEYRLGAEYQFAKMGEYPLFLRAGVWRDPDHAFAAGMDPRPALGSNNSITNLGATIDTFLFQPGDDEIHYSIGFGFSSTRFQVDAAYDASDLVDKFSLSTVWRF